MQTRALIRFAWRAMTDRKLRASLTIIGIMIGPATIVALLSVTQGFSNSVSGAFAKTGTTSIFVSPSAKGTYFTYADVPIIQKMPGVSVVVPYWLLGGTITQGTQTTSVQVMAGDFSKLGAVLPGLTLATGSVPSGSDLGGAAVGWSIANPNIAGARELRVNQVVTVSLGGSGGFLGGGSSGVSGQKSFIIRGIYNKFGAGFFINPDSGIFVPLSEGQALLHTNHYSGIIVVASSASTVNEVTNELASQYGQKVSILAVTSILSTIQSITGAIGTILVAVAGVSILVAFIGIMTTMFTTVVERTKEIGVLKALGYASHNILLLFLTEAAITGFLGGLIGASAGAALSFVLVSILTGLAAGGGGASAGATTTSSARGAFGGGGGFGGGSAGAGFSSLTITPAVSPELFLLAIALATAVGAIAGLLPAWRASRLLPVEALYSQ
jgi:putative ABC transport system permease protein